MWRPTELGEVIAERRLTFRQLGRDPSNVTVRFGKPVREPHPDESAPWWCPIQVEGLGVARVSGIAGEDSLQALVLALEFVTKDLPFRAQELGGELDWLDEREQLVFAGTFMRDLQVDAINRLAGALQAAVELLERTDLTRSPEHTDLLKQFRNLIQSGGFSAKASNADEAG